MKCFTESIELKYKIIQIKNKTGSIEKKNKILLQSLFYTSIYDSRTTDTLSDIWE